MEPYKAENTIFQPQNVVSAQEGLDELAKGLSSVATVAAKGAKVFKEEKSNAALYTQTSNVLDARHKALYDIGTANSPEAAQAAADKYTKTTELMRENAHDLTGKDREKFNTFIQSNTDKIDTAAINRQVHILRKANENNLFGSYQHNLNNYSDMLLTNPKQAEAFYQIQIKGFTDALHAGIITQDKYDNAVGGYNYQRDGATQLLRTINEGRGTAVDYNTHTANSSVNTADRPTTEAVAKWHLDRNKQTNYSDAVRDLQNGQLDWATYMNFSKSDRTMFDAAVTGYQRAQGLLLSNTPMQLVNERIAKLSNSGSALTEDDRIELQTLQDSQKQLDNDFNGYILNTAAGAKIAQNSRDELAGINSSNWSDEQKQQAIHQLTNKTISSVVNLAKVQGIPTNKIKPLPVADIQSISQGFSKGGDPNSVINTISQYDKSNAYWVGNSIKDPAQSQIAQALTYTHNDSNPPSMVVQNRMIVANQDGMSFAGLDQEKAKSTDDKAINAQIVTQLGPILSYLKTLPHGVQQANGMVKSVTNFVKYSALSDGDTALGNKDKYISDGVALYQDAYPIVAGNGYTFNKNDVDIAPSDIRNLTFMVGQQLKKSGYDETTPWTVTYRGGDLIAINQYGDTIYQMPYNRHLLSAASGIWRSYGEQQQIAEGNKILNQSAQIGILPNG